MTQQTFGQKAVGLSFNPSGDDAVSECKQHFADAIDQMNDLRNSASSPEVKVHCRTGSLENNDRPQRRQ